MESENKENIVHVPVMMAEVLEALQLRSGDCVVDGTLGMGGHALEILKKIGPQGSFIGIDRDEESLSRAKNRLRDYQSQCRFLHEDFRNLDKALDQAGIGQVDAMLFDLGISSFQLENSERGFSLKNDGPLDMRMDKKSYISAYDLINSLSEKELSSILRNFGEERFHNRIAHHLVRERQRNPIESTRGLSEVVLRAVPSYYQHQRIHPATRTFQAFRIAVNRELEALEIVLGKCLQFLKNNARLCVISFHSLEDRIVKNKFRDFSQRKELKIITKKPLCPQDEEMKINPRSRSAKLRVAERIC